jgi:16S rRNA processing protein RimM
MSSKSSTSRPGDWVAVGRVLRAHGLRGDVVVESLSDNPERFAPGSVLAAFSRGALDAAGPGSPLEPSPLEPLPPESPPPVPRQHLEVAAAQPHGGALRVRFAGCDDRDAAEALRGLELAVAVGEVPAPPEGEYWHFQLLGCRCIDAAAGDLGEVVDLVEDGGGLLLVVDDGQRRVPVPFVRAFLRRVDPEGRKIELELPPGLLEVCASRS